jgi:HK97 family phage major capsid protein
VARLFLMGAITSLMFRDAAASDASGGTLTPETKAVIDEVKRFGADHKAVIEKIHNETKDEIKTIKDEVKSFVKKDEFERFTEKLEELNKTAGTALGNMPVNKKSFEDSLCEALEKKAFDLEKQGVKGVRTGQPFKMLMEETKAVGDVQLANFTGTASQAFIPPTFRPGIIMNPFETTRLRNILPIGATGSNKITYPRENGGEGDVGMVAPGGTKPQVDFDLTLEEADVRKIAGHIRVHEEVLEDIPYITAYLTRKGTQKVLDKEDSQILYGDGTGQNLEGLFTAATTFAAPAGAVVASPNRFDVLRAAQLVGRMASRNLNVALVSPLDYFLMESVKDTTGNYVLMGGGNGMPATFNGLAVMPHTKIVAGDFLVMDRDSAEIAFRKGIEVRFYEQDRDNAITNMITIVIEERLALPIYEAAGLVKGTFGAAITDLTS